MGSPIRLPVITSENILQFSGGITSLSSDFIQNGVILPYSNNKYYITQRPSFETFNQTAAPDSMGRGVFFWAADSTLYIVNDTKVYLNDYSSELTPDVTYGTALTTGSERVYFAELNGVLFIIDPQGNEGKYVPSTASTTFFDMAVNPDSPWSANNISFTAPSTISAAGIEDFSNLQAGDRITVASTSGLNDGTYTVASAVTLSITIVEDTLTTETAGAAGTVTITDVTFSAFPPNNGLTLAHGVAVLDKTMYVLATNGQIWGSELNDGTDWSDGLNFITAEKEEDTKNYIDIHHDHIVVFGERTIEFFYDAGNEVGSPLSARNDISFNIGCADPNSVWRNGDEIYFLGIDTNGEVAAYLLKNFSISKVSSTTITSFVTTSRASGGFGTAGSGVSAGNVNYYVLTTYHLVSGIIVPDQTIVYNSLTSTWTRWIHSDPTIDQFPLIAWAVTDTSRIGQGILSSGEIISLFDNFVPQDGEAGARYITTGYVSAGYYLGAAATVEPIALKIRINGWDGDTRNWKFCSEMRYIGDTTSNTQDLTVRWSDGSEREFNAGRVLDISDNKNKLTALGRFKSRSWELAYQGNEQIRIEGIELVVDVGSH